MLKTKIYASIITMILVFTCFLTFAWEAVTQAQESNQRLKETVSGTIKPSGGNQDDTARIQKLIDSSTGEIVFDAGTFLLTRPLRLKSARSYRGERSWDMRYGSVLMQQTPGEAIFVLDDVVDSVVITGLTFAGRYGAPVKGIVAANPKGLLANSTLRDNHFYTELTECINTPMVLTRLERNQFGLHGNAIHEKHQHIRSVYPGDIVGANANWLVGNQFSSARGGESVLFEQGAQLHITGNQFEGNEASTTLRINGMFQVVIEGNYFERNAGLAVMEFANGLNNQLGNWIVRLENNFYNMAGNGTPTKFIFLASGATAVYLGYEAGTAFAPDAELTSAELFNACYLRVRGPFRFNGYLGAQAGGMAGCQ